MLKKISDTWWIFYHNRLAFFDSDYNTLMKRIDAYLLPDEKIGECPVCAKNVRVDESHIEEGYIYHFDCKAWEYEMEAKADAQEDSLWI